MTYEEAKNHLVEKDIDLDDLEEQDGLLPGFQKADLDDFEVNGEDTYKPFLVFDPDEKLAGVAYHFRWDIDRDGKSKAWKFQQEVSEIITLKYGNPTSDDTEATRGEDIEVDVVLETKWYDEKTNEQIVL